MSRNGSNRYQAQRLLDRVARGDSNILSNQELLSSFDWKDEGLTAIKKTALFLSGCGVEGALLTMAVLAKAKGYW